MLQTHSVSFDPKTLEDILRVLNGGKKPMLSVDSESLAAFREIIKEWKAARIAEQRQSLRIAAYVLFAGPLFFPAVIAFQFWVISLVTPAVHDFFEHVVNASSAGQGAVFGLLVYFVLFLGRALQGKSVF